MDDTFPSPDSVARLSRNATTMALPEELLVLIFEQLQAADCPAGLSAACQTSKTWCRLARPILFRVLRLGPHVWTRERYRNPLPMTSCVAPRVIPALRTLTMRPELCAYVQTVALTAGAPFVDENSISSWIRCSVGSWDDAALQQQYLEALERLEMSENLKRGIRSRFRHHRATQAAIALILALCPNIVTCSLFHADAEGLFHRILGSEKQFIRDETAPLLTRLQTLQLDCGSMEQSRMCDLTNLILIGRALSLPAVDSFRSSGVCSVDAPTLGLLGAQFKHMSLKKSAFRIDDLSNILEACPRLVTLEVQWSWIPGDFVTQHREDADRVLANRVASIFLEHGSHLQHLQIYDEEGNSWSQSGDGPVEPSTDGSREIVSLKDLDFEVYELLARRNANDHPGDRFKDVTPCEVWLPLEKEYDTYLDTEMPGDWESDEE